MAQTRRDLILGGASLAGTAVLMPTLLQLACATSGTGGPGASRSSGTGLPGGLYPFGSREVNLLPADPSRRYFYYAIVSDTHVPDDVYFEYDGVEGNDLDTRTMRMAAQQFTAARDHLNTFAPHLDLVLIPGDFIHNYPTVEMGFSNPNDEAYYANNVTRLDIAKQIADGFAAPTFVGLGNHDYDIGNIHREFTQELFQEKLGQPSYYAVNHLGVKFLMLDNFLGETQRPGSSVYDTGRGSLGAEQTEWLQAQLEQGMPTVVFVHYPLILFDTVEIADTGLLPLLQRYREQIGYVFAGHTHRWLNLGNNFGPPHYVVGATRYDPDAYVICEVDTQTGAHVLLNEALWSGLDIAAERYEPAEFLAYIEARRSS